MKSPSHVNDHPLRGFWRGAARAPEHLIFVALILWAAGALFYDPPLPFRLRVALSSCWLTGALATLFFLSSKRTSRIVILTGFAVIAGWWFTLRPSQNRDWKPEVAVLARSELKGDLLTIHNVRNFQYTALESFTPRYESRVYELGKLKGVDMFLSKWGPELMGHPIVSFDFGTGGRLAFSIEIRPERGEGFDPLGSIYRKFELIYIPSDERDVIRVRTNFRTNEEVFLYRIMTTPEQARERLLQYASRINGLHDRPGWYNVITANCATSIRAQQPRAERLPWDWRVLFNGRADEMLYDRGALDRTYPFEELKRRSRINAAAKAAGDSPDFSALIRRGLPGFE